MHLVLPLVLQILEQSVWILGNLAGESTLSRDLVLVRGALTPISACLACPAFSFSCHYH